jgi:Beige/BEACH domain
MQMIFNTNDDISAGRLQGKKQAVGDVILPAWATSVDDFIRQHRNALGKTTSIAIVLRMLKTKKVVDFFLCKV